MAEQPFSPQLAERFFRGATTPAENRDVVRGLLLDGRGALPAPPKPGAPSTAYAGAFERMLARADAEAARLEAERLAAAARLAELEARATRSSSAQLEQLVATDVSFHNPALAKELCRRSFEAGLDDPERSLHLARLAVAVARGAAANQAASLAGRVGADLLAEAWGQLGNALRIASRLHEAVEALATAARHLDAGTGDVLARARLLGLEATLAKDRSMLNLGIARCRKAARLFARAGDLHGRGKMLVVEADLHARQGELRSAVACLDRALEAIDAETEPRLRLVVLHNLASYLDQQERFEAAWQRLEQARALTTALGHRLDRIRLRWLEGRIAGHLDRAGHAENCLLEARAAFISLGVPYDAALVMLDLAALLVPQDRHAEVGALVEEMVPVFAAQDLPGEAQAALAVFRDAVRSHSAGLELIQQVAERLEKNRRGSDSLGF